LIKNSKNQSKKLKQFTKLCKGDISQNSKTAKMVLGRYYRVLNSRLALTHEALFTINMVETNANNKKNTHSLSKQNNQDHAWSTEHNKLSDLSKLVKNLYVRLAIISDTESKLK